MLVYIRVNICYSLPHPLSSAGTSLLPFVPRPSSANTGVLCIPMSTSQTSRRPQQSINIVFHFTDSDSRQTNHTKLGRSSLLRPSFLTLKRQTCLHSLSLWDLANTSSGPLARSGYWSQKGNSSDNFLAVTHKTLARMQRLFTSASRKGLGISEKAIARKIPRRLDM